MQKRKTRKRTPAAMPETVTAPAPVQVEALTDTFRFLTENSFDAITETLYTRNIFGGTLVRYVHAVDGKPYASGIVFVPDNTPDYGTGTLGMMRR